MIAAALTPPTAADQADPAAIATVLRAALAAELADNPAAIDAPVADTRRREGDTTFEAALGQAMAGAPLRRPVTTTGSRSLRTLTRTAKHAARASRPVALIAAGLLVLDRDRPRGMSPWTEHVWTMAVVSADWRSGRRSRPGRHDTAQYLECALSTVTRQWELLQRAGLWTRVAEGRHMSTADHEAAVAAGAVCICAPGVEAAEARLHARTTGSPTCYKRQRAEYELASPEGLGVTAGDLTPALIARAENLLAELGDFGTTRSSNHGPMFPEPTVAPPPSEDPEIPTDPEVETTQDDPQCFHASPSPVGGPFTGLSGYRWSLYARYAHRGDDGDTSKSSYPVAGTRRTRPSTHRPNRWKGIDETTRGVAQNLISRARRGGSLPQLAHAIGPLLARKILAAGLWGRTAIQIEELVQDGVRTQIERHGFYFPPTVVSRGAPRDTKSAIRSPESWLVWLATLPPVTDEERAEMAANEAREKALVEAKRRAKQIAREKARIDREREREQHERAERNVSRGPSTNISAEAKAIARAHAAAAKAKKTSATSAMTRQAPRVNDPARRAQRRRENLTNAIVVRAAAEGRPLPAQGALTSTETSVDEAERARQMAELERLMMLGEN